MGLTIIRHRVNTLKELQLMDPAWGAEIDLRSIVGQPGSIHLSHEPWVRGDDFEEWLRLFNQRGIKGPLVLNTKEEGLEKTILEVLRQHAVNNFFFLDTAFPTLVKWALRDGLSQFAVRTSSFESLETVYHFKGKAEWVWVDCFDGIPPTVDLMHNLKGFKACLVSPELQGKPVDLIPSFLPLLPFSHAVCTKRPDLWKSIKP